MKRAADLLLALFAVFMFLLPMLLVAFLVKVTSKGPVLYWSDRVGQYNNIFKMPKFRSMKIDTPIVATHLLSDSKNALTSVGAFLRKSSLDELPQLFSILKGDMSFVGPRPDVPGYADKLVGESRRVLEMRPGITGPATLKYSNEEKLLAGVDNPKKYNDEVIFPDKVKINLEYIDNWSLWMDIKIIFKTIFRKNY